MGFRKYYTKDDFNKACEESFSIAEVCRKLGLISVGGNYRTIHRLIALYEPNVSHWTGQLWSKGKILKSDTKGYARNKQRKQLLILSRGRKCENCQLETWLELPIALELDHIDGNCFNNDETNLRML